MSAADDGAVVPGLDLTLVDLIAQRVLQLLGDRNGDEIQLLTVAQVARRFQVHPSWVYANARRLGALRLGTGPKAPLRFDPRRVALAVEGPAAVRRYAYLEHAGPRAPWRSRCDGRPS
jgi:hypothetical protein